MSDANFRIAVERCGSNRPDMGKHKDMGPDMGTRVSTRILLLSRTLSYRIRGWQLTHKRESTTAQRRARAGRERDGADGSLVLPDGRKGFRLILGKLNTLTRSVSKSDEVSYRRSPCCMRRCTQSLLAHGMPWKRDSSIYETGLTTESIAAASSMAALASCRALCLSCQRMLRLILMAFGYSSSLFGVVRRYSSMPSLSLLTCLMTDVVTRK